MQYSCDDYIKVYSYDKFPYISIQIGRHSTMHTYYFCDRTKFVNIPKNASSTFLASIKNQGRISADLICFAIIREPFDRLKSTFAYLSYKYKMSFEIIVDLLHGKKLVEEHQIIMMMHFLPQHFFLKHAVDDPMQIKLIPITNLYDNKFIRKHFNIKTLQRKNVTPKFYFKTEVNDWIEKNKEWIKKFYSEDFVLWNQINNND